MDFVGSLGWGCAILWCVVLIVSGFFIKPVPTAWDIREADRQRRIREAEATEAPLD